MNPFALVLALAALLGGTFLIARKAGAAEMTMPETLDSLFQKHGEIYGIDPLLLKAIAMVESSLNVDAVRWKPPHDVSAGLMQILCKPPAGVQEGENYTCANRFDIAPWPVAFDDLKNPDLNISLAAQILKWNLDTYGFPHGLAVYNHWGARNSPRNGPYPNQSYVDKVLRNFNNLKGAS